VSSNLTVWPIFQENLMPTATCKICGYQVAHHRKGRCDKRMKHHLSTKHSQDEIREWQELHPPEQELKHEAQGIQGQPTT
jgi:hypothetical protein